MAAIQAKAEVAGSVWKIVTRSARRSRRRHPHDHRIDEDGDSRHRRGTAARSTSSWSTRRAPSARARSWRCSYAMSGARARQPRRRRLERPRSRSCGSAAARRWRWAAPRRSPSIMSAAASRSASASPGWSTRARSRKSASSPARASTTDGTLKRRRARALRHGPREHRRPAGRGRRRGLHRSAAARAGAATARRAARAASSRISRASYRIPLVNLIDGAGGSVTSINKRGHAVFPGVHGFERSVELLGKVPVVCAVLGTAAGGPAGRAILSHWSVMVEGHQPGLRRRPAGGRALARPEDHQGGARRPAGRRRHRRHDRQSRRRARTACFAEMRRFLSYMPQNVWELPPVVAGDRSGRSLRRRAAVASCRATGASPTTCAS